MYKRQADFQRLAYPEHDFDNLTRDERIALSKDMILHLQSEANEFMGEMAWKAKRRQSPHIVMGNLLDESIDVLKMAMTLPILWGFTADEVIAAFHDKSMVVEQRYRQEFPLYEIIAKAEAIGAPTIVALDIDGVLSDWPNCFYSFVDKTHPDEMIPSEQFFTTANPFEGLDNNPLQVRQWKDEYRQSGFKRTIDAVNGATAFTHKLRSLGYTIVLLTARPYRQYSRTFADTMYWLGLHDIRYDAIMWSDNKEARLAEEFSPAIVAAFIDDDEHNVDRVRASGFTAMLYQRPYNVGGLTFRDILERLT
jgi:hypothetical protein